MREFQIAVFPGDGIGAEVRTPCLALLESVVARTGGFRLAFTSYEAGAALYRDTGVSLPPGAVDAVGRTDAILLGAMGLPGVRAWRPRPTSGIGTTSSSRVTALPRTSLDEASPTPRRCSCRAG